MSDAAPSARDRHRGCLLGGAVGDALGAAVEFESIDVIRSRFGPRGIADPAEAYGRVGAFTDDTQMALFTAEALLQVHDACDADTDPPLAVLWEAYQRWLVTQDERSPLTPDDPALSRGVLHLIPELYERRSPGLTCVSALLLPRDLGTWDYRAVNDSKGCGGVMRAAPCGMVGGRWDRESAFALGVGSAALTHGHPSGSTAAGALAVIVHALCAGEELGAALSAAQAAVDEIAGGDEVAAALRNARRLVQNHPGEHEALTGLGEGWVAEEALAIAVYCAGSHRDDFEAAVRLAANHSGDSDSTAAITGNILGALLGADAIPARWFDALELRDLIDWLADELHGTFAEGRRGSGWVATHSDAIADLARKINAGEPREAELAGAIRDGWLTFACPADPEDENLFAPLTVSDRAGLELLAVFTRPWRARAVFERDLRFLKVGAGDVPSDWRDIPVVLDPGCGHSLRLDLNRILS